MESEFDREMDVLLRQSARGETVSANSKFQIEDSKLPHLDADEISAFAENALPEKAKQLLTAHLADCGRCRKILSNVISLNSETASQTVQAPENVKIANVAAVKTPWYRRLFAAPNLAYAMGALVFVFAGLIAVTFLQKSAQNSEVSQMREMPTTDARVETRTAESGASSSSSSNSGLSNSSMMSNGGAAAANSAVVSSPSDGGGGATVKNAAPNSVSSNSNAASTEKTGGEKRGEPKNSLPAKPPAAAAPPTNAAQSPTRASNSAEQKKETPDGEDNPRAQERAQENDAAQTDNKVKSLPAVLPSGALLRPKPPNAYAPPAAAADSSISPRAKTARQSVSRTVESGGKTFRREGAVWYDSDYKGQSTQNVRRGSEEFKKLDAGLRSIAERLGGAVVVVWKSRAYRIQ